MKIFYFILNFKQITKTPYLPSLFVKFSKCCSSRDLSFWVKSDKPLIINSKLNEKCLKTSLNKMMSTNFWHCYKKLPLFIRLLIAVRLVCFSRIFHCGIFWNWCCTSVGISFTTFFVPKKPATTVDSTIETRTMPNRTMYFFIPLLLSGTFIYREQK